MKLAAIVALTALSAATSTIVLADCDWILWHDLQVILPRDPGQKEWTVAGTARTFDECVALRESTVEEHFKRLQSNRPDPGGSVLRGGPTIVITANYGRTEIRYSCWPETKDPRH